MSNLVVHFEIHASDPQKLIDFYSSLLGWQFTEYGGGDQPYWVIDTGDGAIARSGQAGGFRDQWRIGDAPRTASRRGRAGYRLQHRGRR